MSAGAPQEKAKAAAAIPAGRDMATKQDIANMVTKHDIADMATKQDIAELKQEVAAVKQDIAVLKFAVFTFLPLILALLAKLVFFP